jgi:hypothetical protein
MPVPKSVRAWVADAEATYGPTFNRWFPEDFAWQELCADVPEMAERLGETWKSPTAAAAKARLEETARSAFIGAYIASLALLAGYDALHEPDDALPRLCSPPTPDEQDVTAETLATDLAAVEATLVRGSERIEPSLRARRAAKVARVVREPVRELLTEGLAQAAQTLVGLGAARGPMAKVLAGVVNVAVSLAGLRYAVTAEVDREAGEDPLALDEDAIRSALGGDEDE